MHDNTIDATTTLTLNSGGRIANVAGPNATRRRLTAAAMRDANSCAECGEQQALGEQLACDSTPSCAERGSNGDLAAPGYSTSK